jgi:hypothetical protein
MKATNKIFVLLSTLTKAEYYLLNRGKSFYVTYSRYERREAYA